MGVFDLEPCVGVGIDGRAGIVFARSRRVVPDMLENVE